MTNVNIFHNHSTVTGHWFLYADLDGDIESRIGSMMLRPDGMIVSISVMPTHRRQGIATRIYQYALNHPDIPDPVHSDTRTTSGNLWAIAVGGYLPENKMRKLSSTSEVEVLL